MPSATRRCVRPSRSWKSYSTPLFTSWIMALCALSTTWVDDGRNCASSASFSYGRGTRRVSDDRGLIRYLMRNRHTSPFEMCEIKTSRKSCLSSSPGNGFDTALRMLTSILLDTRYLTGSFYVPSEEGHRFTVTEQSTRSRRITFCRRKRRACNGSCVMTPHLVYDHYEQLLNQRSDGEPHDPDQAGPSTRVGADQFIPEHYYTQWYWKIDLHNLLHFLTLRADYHAQYEIRVYAEAILERIVRSWVPLTHEAFCDYQLNGKMLSSQALSVVRALVNGRGSEAELLRDGSGMASREWRELIEKP